MGVGGGEAEMAYQMRPGEELERTLLLWKGGGR